MTMFRKSMPVAAVAVAIATLGSSIAMGQEGFGDADTNKDQSVDAKELKAYVAGRVQGFDQHKRLFAALDSNGDTTLSAREFENRMTAIESIRQTQSEAPRKSSPKPQQEVRPNARQRKSAALKIGDIAPTFKLKSLDGKTETDLASFAGKKPVVLIFGSYT